MTQKTPSPQGSSAETERDLRAHHKRVLRLERELRSRQRTARISEDIAEKSKRLLLSTQDKLEKEILQHRQTEEELRAASLASKAASDAKSRFLATMSHEMRTPLNGVVGVLDLLLETPLNNRQHELGRLAQDSASALIVLINRVLEFSKMEAGHLELRATPVDIRRSLEDLVALEAIAAHAKGLKICAVIEPKLPQQLLVDGNRLRQILLNLISNAVKYTHSGEVNLRVNFQGEGESGVLTCEVFDTGVGMSPDDCIHLFQPFTQADSSTTRPFEGTGLGLTISRRLASLMGGKLTVKSELGQGSAFRLVVPATTPSGLKERTPRQVLLGRKVGVLDRHHAFVDFVSTVVEPLGGLVVSAADEVEARRLASTEDLFVLLADQEFEELAASLTLGVPLILTGPRKIEGAPERAPNVLTLNKPMQASRLAEALILSLSMITSGALASFESSGPRTTTSPGGRWDTRVLLVDDNESNRSVARLMLERLGCRVEAVDNGLAALRAVEDEAFDLVFMDCSMPGLDGYETTRRLRAQKTERMPIVIAMTAFAMPEDRQRCLDAGMDDYTSKPVGLKTIRGLLEQHLGPPQQQ